MKKFWLIEVCYALILLTYSFEAIGSDRDPETGKTIRTKEEVEASQKKYSSRDHYPK